jgi:hypothetical protein
MRPATIVLAARKPAASIRRDVFGKLTDTVAMAPQICVRDRSPRRDRIQSGASRA